jgi:protein-S-isoprenylcysteine O-methyltransferase Ste14
LAIGWAIAVRSWLTLAYALLLLVFLDVKSRREEQWLRERFPTYRDYQRRVRKLVPFLY